MMKGKKLRDQTSLTNDKLVQGKDGDIFDEFDSSWLNIYTTSLQHYLKLILNSHYMHL